MFTHDVAKPHVLRDSSRFQKDLNNVFITQTYLIIAIVTPDPIVTPGPKLEIHSQLHLFNETDLA